MVNMSNKTANTGEWVSALHDDALHEWPQHHVLDDEALAHWQAAVHIQQALRSDHGVQVGSQQRVLEAMQVVYRESASGKRSGSLVHAALGQTQPGLSHREAANAHGAAWPWAAALVLAIGAWWAWPQQPSTEVVMASRSPVEAPVASVAQAEPVLVEQNGVLRDPRLDALLQSHRQSGLGSALQYPAGFVRSVALER